MADYFFDSSALVKLYVAETGSTWVSALAEPSAAHHIFIARISAVELASAVARRERAGHLTRSEAVLARSQFDADLAYLFRVVEISKSLLTQAMTHAEVHFLRAYDAVQLSAALVLATERAARGMSPITLISADAALNGAAVAEGLRAENPNLHP